MLAGKNSLVPIFKNNDNIKNCSHCRCIKLI